MGLPRALASVTCRRIVLQIICLTTVGVVSGEPQAALLEVQVTDRDGNPVTDVAVYAMPADGTVRKATPETKAVMDQIDVRFVPHLLVVQTGTSVSFPNTDSIGHHVYSFSNPNDFMLPMYKGDLHPPMQFQHAGVVTLGCNIHDDMLGYILIVDTRVFSKTNNVVRATLATNYSGETDVHIWSPRLRDKGAALSQRVLVSDSEKQTAKFTLTKKLRPRHDAGSEAITWSEY